eukprot:gene7892-12360_t
MIVISDTHIGGIRFVNKTRQLLLHQIFSQLQKNEKLHTLIINGDFLETWLDPFDVEPPTIESILVNRNVHGSNVFEYMKQLDTLASQKDVQVVILKGNHDISISQKKFNLAGWKNVKIPEDGYFNFGNLVAHHGHQFDVWNTPDPVKGLLPYGYICTRVEGERAKKMFNFDSKKIIEYDKKNDWNPTIKWLCSNILASRAAITYFKNDISWINPRILGRMLGGTFWDNIYKRKYDEHADRIVKGACFYGDEKGQENNDIKLKYFVSKYTTLFKRIVDKYSIEHLSNMIQCSCHQYQPMLDSIDKKEQENHMKTGQKKIYVLGHNHTPDLKEMKNIVYANSGSWVNSAKLLPFIKIKFNPENKVMQSVKLIEFNPRFGHRLLKSWETDSTKTTTNSASNFQKIDFLNKQNRKHEIDGWTCPKEFYGTNDGCDCNCGEKIDPDCKGINKCRC